MFLAIWIPPAWERYSLLLLLVGASLSMAAVCHAIGFGCEPSFVRTALRRGSAHLIALAIHTAIVFLLVAWPLMLLSQAPSLAAALGLAVALVVALLVLWRFWPVFGLVFAGYFFGNLPFIKQYLNLIVLAGIGAAVVPLLLGGLWKLVRGKSRTPRAPADR